MSHLSNHENGAIFHALQFTLNAQHINPRRVWETTEDHTGVHPYQLRTGR